MALLPLGLILLSFTLVLCYHVELKNSLSEYESQVGSHNLKSKTILEAADYTDIPNAIELMLLYLGIFLSAELAFIMMATREYLQDVIHIPEMVLFGGVGLSPPEQLLPCIVFFETLPRGAYVYLDGEYVGSTPVSTKVAPDVHVVRLKPTDPDYVEWQGPLEIKKGQTSLPFSVELPRR